MHLYFKKNDKDYIIQGLDGTKYFINNISDCYKELIDADLIFRILITNQEMKENIIILLIRGTVQ